MRFTKKDRLKAIDKQNKIQDYVSSIRNFKIQITAETDEKNLTTAFIIPYNDIEGANYDLLTLTIRENVLALKNAIEEE